MTPKQTEIQFTKQLAYSSAFPQPILPALPKAPGSSTKQRRAIPTHVGKTFIVAKARCALALIAKAELSPGDEVLLPAYHCPALVEPFLWAGCRVSFYNMDENLQPDIEDFDRKLRSCNAVVIVRYFGFDTNIQETVKQARRRDCIIIEDLAHAAFIDTLYGDYGVTSLAKFFPVQDGAEIYVNQKHDSLSLERCISSHQSSLTDWNIRSTWRKMNRKIQVLSGKRPSQKLIYRYFDAFDLRKPWRKNQLLLNELMQHNGMQISSARRSNYLKIHEALKLSDLGSPLFSKLEDNTTPYVYPFLLRNPDDFRLVRNAGIPLFRWEELASTPCPISADYRGRLIQIPCHQDLLDDDISAISNVFTQCSGISNHPKPAIH